MKPYETKEKTFSTVPVSYFSYLNNVSTTTTTTTTTTTATATTATTATTTTTTTKQKKNSCLSEKVLTKTHQQPSIIISSSNFTPAWNALKGLARPALLDPHKVGLYIVILWSYNPYKWLYKFVTGVIILLIGVVTICTNDRDPSCTHFHDFPVSKPKKPAKTFFLFNRS